MGLERYKGDMEMCCRCSACKFVPMQRVSGLEYANVCPSIARYNFHSYSGGGRLNIGNAALKKGMNYTPRLLDIVYNCQMCGACGVSCNYAMDMEVMQPISEFRIQCVRDGQTHPALDRMIERLRQTGSSVPVSGRRGAWAAGLGLKDATRERVGTLLYVGDLSSYEAAAQKVARAAARLLGKAGVDFGIAGDAESSSGAAAYEAGYEEVFLEQARKNAAFFEQAGIDTVLTLSPHDYYAFKVLYEKFRLRGALQVRHISEYLLELVQAGRLRTHRRVDLALTYHDPCHLGRLSEPWVHWEGKKVPGDRFVFDPPKQYRRGSGGCYEPPRELLRSIPGVRLSEMPRTREYAWCCGAGGGVSESNPEFAQWTARERIAEAEASGAEALVTTCTGCEQGLGAAAQSSGSRLQVLDLVELVEQSVE
ncbi:MAG: (Fe-S)-binding protein [Gammaproteobacteria bacterium]|nr:(Fe-S)-binding protein [Gammaproteobacteria bacterium]